jgi:hypothetical protein
LESVHRFGQVRHASRLEYSVPYLVSRSLNNSLPIGQVKTIVLAVSPALKSIGVPSRPRLFEAKERIRMFEAYTHTKVEYPVP